MNYKYNTFNIKVTNEKITIKARYDSWSLDIKINDNAAIIEALYWKDVYHHLTNYNGHTHLEVNNNLYQVSQYGFDKTFGTDFDSLLKGELEELEYYAVDKDTQKEIFDYING